MVLKTACKLNPRFNISKGLICPGLPGLVKVRLQVFLAVFFLFMSSVAIAQNGGQNLSFAFTTENKGLVKLTFDSGNNELAFAYVPVGSPGILLQDKLDDSIAIFTYTYYFRGGGKVNAGLDLNYLSFIYGLNKYTLYQEYSAEANSTEIGLRISELTSEEEEVEIIGLIEAMSGNLTDFRAVVPEAEK